jgi:hypothetical protein
MDSADGVARIVLAGQQRFGFGRDQLMFQTAEQFAQFLQRSFIFSANSKSTPRQKSRY